MRYVGGPLCGQVTEGFSFYRDSSGKLYPPAKGDRLLASESPAVGVYVKTTQAGDTFYLYHPPQA